MDEFEALLDSLIQRQKASQISYIGDKYADCIEIKQTSSKGEGVFAKQFLSVKDPICSLSYPIINAIECEFLKTTCYHCLIVTRGPLPLESWGHISGELKTCNGCGIARFCDRGCQVKAWPAYHKYECRIFKKLHQKLPPASLRAVMRIVLLKDRALLEDKQWNGIIALTSHEYALSARGSSNMTDMAVAIKNLTNCAMDIRMIEKLVLIFKFNATELPTPIYGGIGVMLDPLLAKFNHSCEPNLALHRPQHTTISGWTKSPQLSEEEQRIFAHIIPLRDINQGEELLNCYVAPIMSVDVRKAQLARDYQFDCGCTKCLSDTEASAKMCDERPNVVAQFERWVRSIAHNLSVVKVKPGPVPAVATEMDKLSRYFEYPVLYTTGDIPEKLMDVVLESLKSKAMDTALVNMLRIHFLINPSRFVGRHNPTNTYTIFLILDMLDSLLSNASESTFDSRNCEASLQNLRVRGLSEDGLIYWRWRIHANLKRRLEDSAAKDLLVLVDKREQQLYPLSHKIMKIESEQIIGSLEQEMGVALGLKEPLWSVVLKQSLC